MSPSPQNPTRGFLIDYLMLSRPVSFCRPFCLCLCACGIVTDGTAAGATARHAGKEW